MKLARASKSLVVLSHLVSMTTTMMMMMPVPTHSQEEECPIEPGYEPVVTKPGANLTLALMLELHDAGGIDAAECNFSEPANPDREQAKLVAEAATDAWPSSIQLPGLSVGLEIYDTCSSLDVGRFAASRYANRRNEKLYSNSTAACTASTLRLGVVGFESSSLSGPLSMVLQPLDIPVIDFTSTADGLSDTVKYPNFFRTVPPDTATIQVLVAVAKSFGWTYIKMIHNGNEFGLSGERALTAAYQAEGCCLSESIVIDRRETRDEAYDDIINQCVQQNVKVVILWTSSFNVIRLFKAIDRIGGAAHNIQLVTADSILYVPFNDMSDGEKAAARGLIAVSPFVRSEVYKTWLAQFHPGINFTFLPSGLLIDTIHSYLDAFSLAHQEKCGGQSGMCDALASIQGAEFIQYVKRVNFTGVSGGTVGFNRNGDPAQSSFEILQYKSTVGAGGYSLQMVGEWDATAGLTLDKAVMEFYGEFGLLAQPPMSTCEEGSCTDPRCRSGFPKFVIEAMFDLHGSGCDTLRENRFTQVQAALFAVDRINRDSSVLPGVHLSMTVSDICGNVEDAGRVAFQLIREWDFGGGFPTRSDETYLLGMLHSGSSGKAIEESRTLQIVDVPLLANSATSPALSDNEEFPNFLRTVPSDIKQTLAMADVLASLGLKHVQVINSRGTYGEGGAQAFRDAAKKIGVCIINSFTVDSNTNYGTLLSDLMAKPDARVLVLFVTDSDARGLFREMVDQSVGPGYFQIIASDTWGTKAGFIPGMESVAVGALTMTFKSLAIPAFEQYLLNMNPMNQDGSNPFFNEFWSLKFECDLPGGNTQYDNNCTGSEMLTGNDVSSLGIENIINVVHVYSIALSNLINKTCPDGKICDAVADIVPGEWLQYLHDVEFTSPVGSQKSVSFDENGDGDAMFAVYQLIQETGEYQFKEVGEWSDDGGLTLNKSEITYVSQDDSMSNSSSCRQQSEFVIEGLFELHGGECTGLRHNIVFETEAARFAVEAINDNPGLLPQVHLSVALTDICGTPENAGRVAFQLIKDWDFDGGFPTGDESYLMGVLHTGSSGKAIEESRFLQILNVPMISNFATSPALSNKEEFGNFLRTVPSDTKQAKLITEVLASLGLTYIQVVNSKGAYGEGGAQAIKEAGGKVGVCVANSYTVDSNTDYDALVGNLMAKSDARALVLFLDDDHAVALFQEMVTKNVEPGYFQIIGSDTWGTRSDFIPGLEAPAVGALTVFFKSSVIPMFEDYLWSRNPQDDDSNPFFNEFWQEKFKCSLPGGSTKVRCTGLEVLSQSDVNSMGYEDLINSIYVYATALSQLINKTCPDGKICDAVADVVPGEWLQYLQDVEFTSPFGSQKSVSFDENGDGPALFAVYQLIETNGMYSFVEVGTWDELNGLSNLTDGLIDPMVMATCRGVCAECRPEPTGDNHSLRIPGDLDIPVILQLRERGEGLTCGPPLPDKALVIECLLYTLDQINNDSLVLPGVELGVTIVDSCGNPAIANRELVGVLGGFTQLESSGPTLALLGAVNRDVAEEVSNGLSTPSKIPLVSNSATGTEFDDVQDFPYVLRTSAPFSSQGDAVAQILKKFSWRYAAVVYSSTSYGMANYEEFKKRSSSRLCFAGEHQINDDTDFDEVIQELGSDNDLFVIVAFVEASHARKLLLADEFDRNRRFLWVGTDTWESPAVVAGLEEPASGMIVITSRKPDLSDLQDYFAQLDFEAAIMRDPFLGEYLMKNYICDPSATDCQFGEMVRESVQEMSTEISSLVNALHVIALGASWLQDDKCGSSTEGLCDAFLTADPEEVVTAMQQVTLQSGAGGEPFAFNERSAPVDYTIKNYWYDGLTGQFVIVGGYQDGKLTLEVANVNLHNPASDKFQKVPSSCTCMDPTPSYTKWVWSDHGVWAIVVLAVAGVFALAALAVFILFMNKRLSYIVQGASFSLSLWLLFGIILMYLLNIVYVFDANPAICGIRRFGTSFVYCVVYSAMLAKSIRLNRFSRKDPGEDLDFAGSWSQTLMFLAFLLPEVFLVGEWLILVPSEAGVSGNGEGGCGVNCTFSSYDLTIFMLYAYFLVLVTFLSSFGSKNAPNFQHEGTSLYLSSLFSALILIAWTCVYNLAKPVYSEAAIPIGVTADATIILILMFLPKVMSFCRNKSESKEKKVDFKKRPEKMIHVYDNRDVQVEVAPAIENEDTHF